MAKKKKKQSSTVKTGRPMPLKAPKLLFDTETRLSTGMVTGITRDREPIYIMGTNSVADYVPAYTSSSYTVDVDATSFVGEMATAATGFAFQNRIIQDINNTVTLGNVQLSSGDSFTIRVNGCDLASAGSLTSYTIPAMTVNGSVVTVSGYTSSEISKEEALKQTIKQFMRSNLLIKRGRERGLDKAINSNEIKARNTLRDHITERAYRRYLTNGFIVVQGKSGLCYQVFNDRRHTMVFHNNQKVGEICINTDYSCPPTDHVITIKTLLELDEVSVWNGGNLKKFSEGFQIPFQIAKEVHSYVGGGLNGINGAVMGGVANPYVQDFSLSPNTKKEMNLVEAFKQAKQDLKVA